MVTVPASEKEPAFCSLGFSLSGNELRARVDNALTEYLGPDQHRSMMKSFGFIGTEIDLVVGAI